MPISDDFHADGYEGNPLFSDGIYIVSGKTGSKVKERESRFMFMLKARDRGRSRRKGGSGQCVLMPASRL